jgi:ABC-type sugar transport system ATPase subunit/ribose/xylose/arabinose/galactoside ABC-type transport system permease subunit
MAPLLELLGVTKCFPGVVALDNVDLDLRPGEVHALAGETGAGKSTLIRVVSGTLAPDAGRILLSGRPARLTDPATARRRGIVTAHQEAELFGALSVAENMALARGLPIGPFGSIAWRRVRADARAALAALGASFDVTTPAARLSVAQGHLMQVAAALAHRARMVILDEPTAALSAHEAVWLFENVERLKNDGVGLIYSTNRLDEVFRLADRITVLRDGRRVWTGPTTEIDRSGLVRAMLGRDLPQTAEPSPSPPPTVQSRTPRLRMRDMTDAQGRFEAIDLDVHAGAVLGVYGMRGAGRSEWAQALYGLRRLARGRVEVDGFPHSLATPRDAIGVGIAYVPEDRLRQALCPGLSVRANMVLNDPPSIALGPFAIGPEEARVTREQVAALGVRLRDIAQPIRELSRGNQQKVVLGRSLLTEPKVLLLEEPTRRVEIAAKAEIRHLIRQLAHRGCAVVLISSDLPEVLACSDRIAVFCAGRLAGTFDARTATPDLLAEAALPRPALGSGKSNAHPKPARRRLRPAFRGSAAGLLVVVAALGAVLAATTDGRFQAVDNVHKIMVDAAALAILALGASTVIIAGGIDISIGPLLALAATVGGLVMSRFAKPEEGVLLGVLAALATGAAGGVLNASMALLGRVPPIVVTFGTMTIYQGLLVSLTGGRGLWGLPFEFRRLFMGQLGRSQAEGALVIMLVFALIVHLWLAHFRSGRCLYAYGSNPRAARGVGITGWRVWPLAFGAGGICAALAGLVDPDLNGSTPPNIGTGAELRAIAAAVIGGTAVAGGRGRVAGVVLGALLLTLVQNALELWHVAAIRYDVAVGGLLLAALLGDRALRRSDR